MARLIISPQAESDLVDIGVYIAHQSGSSERARIFRLPYIEVVKHLQLSRKWGKFVQSLPLVVTEVFLLGIMLFISSPCQTASKSPGFSMALAIMEPY